MKTFRFRAAAVLDLRRTEYDAARTELARLTDAMRQANWRTEEAQTASAGAEADFRAALVQGGDGDTLGRHRNWISLQHSVIDQRQRELEECRQATARGAAVVHERFRRVRVLERLRDRQWSRYQLEERRNEAKEMDLLAVLQHARRIPEGENNHDH